MTGNKERMKEQVTEWKRKTWSIPELRGKKQIWYQLIKELVGLIGENVVDDLSAVPELSFSTGQWCWKDYVPFLRGVGLIWSQAGTLRLTKDGVQFLENPSKRLLADQIQKNYRLFGEILYMLLGKPLTVDEIDKSLCKEYCLDWKNLSNTRRRMEWLEVLEMTQAMGDYKWSITEEGKKALSSWCIVQPESLILYQSEDAEVVIEDAPSEIEEELNELRRKPELHKQRCTYNICAPGPDYIEKLRKIVQFSQEKTSKTELFRFLKNEYGLGESSAKTMLPFLKAGGILEERQRSTYQATRMSKAWLETGNQLDFIRIIHLKMRFVGETLYFTQEEISRNQLYKVAQRYGLNIEKTRWMCKFLLEAGLLEETRYLHLKATAKGKCFAKTIPLNIVNENPILKKEKISPEKQPEPYDTKSKGWASLQAAAKNPDSIEKTKGEDLEEETTKLFQAVGFATNRVGGAGDTDITLSWDDENGVKHTAIVDTKSRTNGQVSHNDVSEIALEAHKEKNKAEYVVIVGPGFAGNTIKNFAQKKKYALITTQQLVEIAEASQKLGLTLQEFAIAFDGPDGLQKLNEIIEQRTKEMDLISMIVQQFQSKQDVLGSLSPKEVFWQLYSMKIEVDLPRVIKAFEVLSDKQIGVLHKEKKCDSPENQQYRMYEEKSRVKRMHALAKAIEEGKLMSEEREGEQNG